MTSEQFDTWLAAMVLAVMNPPTPQQEAAAVINRMVRELLEDPAVPWPSELPGPRWR